MPGAVCKFMEERAVVLADAGVLSKLRYGYTIAGGRIERSVAMLNGELDAGALDVVLNDPVSGIVGRKMLSWRRIFCEVRLDALALVDVEYIVIAQKWYALHDRLAICIVNDIAVIISLGGFKKLPKYDHITSENITEILRKEVGIVFTHVLEDAGVYKCTEEGRNAFMRFIETL